MSKNNWEGGGRLWEKAEDVVKWRGCREINNVPLILQLKNNTTEECFENDEHLNIAFVGQGKAFDRADGDKLWPLLEESGMKDIVQTTPEFYTEYIKPLLETKKGHISICTNHWRQEALCTITIKFHYLHGANRIRVYLELEKEDEEYSKGKGKINFKGISFGKCSMNTTNQRKNYKRT